MVLDGQPVPFVTQQDDPSNVWLTAPVPLTGGRLYLIDTGGQTVPGFSWLTSRSTASQIPSTALLPNYSSQVTSEVFTALTKAAIIINGFNLSADEIVYFQSKGPDFGGFDLNAMTLSAWKRIVAYESLRATIPASTSSTLLDLFKWASAQTSTTPAAGTAPATGTTPPTASDIATKIASVMSWTSGQVLALIGTDAFSLTDPTLYRNEIALTRIQNAMTVVKSTGADVPSLFRWANPMAKFWLAHNNWEQVRKLIRSRYSLDDFNGAIKPLNDQLRMNQRDALTAYLVVEEDLVKWGVVDVDSLFEFFLIDVQMGACLKTSRLKQAISSVQLFVQRCMLGLEEHYDVPNDALDQDRWAALSKETIRSANMQVLLHPENYMVSSLRDDKSPIYTDLESALVQQDASASNLKDTLTSYLYGLDEVANLRVEGMYQDSDTNSTLYIVGKTRSFPYKFFYRTFKTVPAIWTPWDAVSVDIPTYQVDATASTPAYSGSYVTPVLWQGRFLIFFGEFAQKTIPVTLTSGTDLSDATVSQIQPLVTWEIKLGWAELRNGVWTQKKTTTESVMQTATTTTPPPIDGYRFVSRIVGTTAANWISVDLYQNGSGTAIGRFEFQGAQAYVAAVDSTTPTVDWSTSTSFHFTGWGAGSSTSLVIYCLQNNAFQSDGTGTKSFVNYPYASYPQDTPSTSTLTVNGTTMPFYHQFSHQLLSTIQTATDLSAVHARRQRECPGRSVQQPPAQHTGYRGWPDHAVAE